jgi:hypothetical protein
MSYDIRSTAEWKRLVVWAKVYMPWVCHLCDQAIPLGLAREHPLSYALDHVLTVSERPDLALSHDNVRPSHRQCNSYRQDRPLTPGLKIEITERFTAKEPVALRFFGEA